MDTQTSPNTSPSSQEWWFVDSTGLPINLLEAFSGATDVHAGYYQDRLSTATGSSDTSMSINGGNSDNHVNGSLGHVYSLTTKSLKHLEYIDGEDVQTSPTHLPGDSQPDSDSESMQPRARGIDYGAKGFSRVYQYETDLRVMTPRGSRTGSGRLKHMVFARPEWMTLEDLGSLDESSIADVQIRNQVVGPLETTQVNGDRNGDHNVVPTGEPVLHDAPTSLDTAQASASSQDGTHLRWTLIDTLDSAWGGSITCNGETVDGDVFHELTLDITLHAD